MKRKGAILVAFTFFLLASCTRQPAKQTGSRADVMAEPDDATLDSLQAEADTLMLDAGLQESPMPVTVDEIFDEFVFAFSQSNRFQRQRIRFPLPILDSDGQVWEKQRRDWAHYSLFLDRDFCTVLWGSHSEMALAEDEEVSEARVEHLYLHSRQIETFDFERDSLSGQWFLVSERMLPFEHHTLHDFLDFYSHFATDSLFQRRHVLNPLHFSMPDENAENGIVEGTIDVDQWMEFAPELPQDVLVNIHYGQLYPNPGHVILQIRGFSNSMQNLLTFSRDHGGRWKLTDFEN